MKRCPVFTGKEHKKKSAGMEIKSLGNLLMRLMEKKSHKEKIESVTGTNGWILFFLCDNKDKDVFQRDLEKKFCITRSTASRVLTLMEQKGLIERHGVEGDARLKKIIMTDKAWEILSLMREDAIMAESVLVRGFSDEELNMFYAMTEKMKANIREELEAN